MQCPSCHSEAAPGARFCAACGTPIPARQPRPADPGSCLRCGAPLQPGAKFCSGCGAMLGDSIAPSAPVPPVAPATPRPARPKPRKQRHLKTGCRLAIAVVAAVAVIALVAALLGGLFGGPMSDIASALIKTLDRGNFTFAIEVAGDSLEGQVDLDMKSRDITLHMVLDADGEALHMIIYKGYAISGYVETGADTDWHIQDIGDTLDMAFEAYEKYGDLESLSLEALLEEAGLLEQAEEYVDIEKLQACLKGYLGKLNDDGWLEENAGYAVVTDGGETLHSFAPNAYEFLRASLPEFESAFQDGDTYDMLKTGLKQSRAYLKQLRIEFSIGVSGGVLSRLEAEIDGEPLLVEIWDTGKTEIDTDELEALLREAKGQS